MGSASPTKLRIAIVGGGIGGLCLARGLIQYDHLDVQVYEAAAKFLQVGAGLALHANAISAMDLIDPEIKQTYFRKANSMAADDEVEMATQVIMAEGKFKGETIAALGRAKGRKTVARHDLLAGYLSLVPEERVHFCKRLVDVEQHDREVVLSFEDGTQATADCLIGADGVHSCTRKYLLGADHPAANPVNFDRRYRVGTLVDMEEVKQALSPRHLGYVPILCGPKGVFNMMPLAYGTKMSVGVGIRAETDDEVGFLPENDVFEGYDADCIAMLNLIRKRYDPNETWVILDHDPAPYYHKGLVAMMGDAAHATGPSIGNGAAQAIEDAAVLHAIFANVYQSEQIEPAFAAFDETRRPRASRVVQIAREVSRLYNYQFDGAWQEEDGLDKLKEHFKSIASFTNDADLSQQNQQALDTFQKLTDSTRQAK